MQCIQELSIILFLFLSDVLNTLAHNVLMTSRGQIGAGNYTYYKLLYKGKPYTVVLNTEKGDSDLYISDQTPYPTFENYELKSDTCGQEVIEIPTEFKRPVGIAIYGHPSYEESSFVISVVSGDPIESYGSTYDTIVDVLNSISDSDHKSTATGNEEEEESVIWSIFIGILKLLFDIMI